VALGRRGQRSVETVEEGDRPLAVAPRLDEFVRETRVEEGELAEGMHESRPDEEGIAVTQSVCRGMRLEGGHEGAVAVRQLVDVPRTRDEGFEEVAEWLETLARAEKSHAGRFQSGLESLS